MGGVSKNARRAPQHRRRRSRRPPSHHCDTFPPAAGRRLHQWFTPIELAGRFEIGLTLGKLGRGGRAGKRSASRASLLICRCIIDSEPPRAVTTGKLTAQVNYGPAGIWRAMERSSRVMVIWSARIYYTHGQAGIKGVLAERLKHRARARTNLAQLALICSDCCALLLPQDLLYRTQCAMQPFVCPARRLGRRPDILRLLIYTFSLSLSLSSPKLK